MLVISRRKGQRICIGDEIELVVTELHRSSVKLGISAPRGYTLLRGEVRDSIEVANKSAAETTLESTEELDEVLLASSGVASGPEQLLSPRQVTGGGTRQIEDEPVNGPEVVVRRRRRDSGTSPPGRTETQESQ